MAARQTKKSEEIKEIERIMKEEKKKKSAKSDKEQAQKTDSVKEGVDRTVEETLISLYKLQTVYSKIDRVRIMRGELPLEVGDLSDECERLQTRIDKFEDAIKEFQVEINSNKENEKNARAQILKYKEQLDNVKNNREFDALNKEIEYEETEIQLCEKRVKEFSTQIKEKDTELAVTTVQLKETSEELARKKNELSAITTETEKEENLLLKLVKTYEKDIESRMLAAFMRIRTNVRNGLATVKVDRNACGGCFSKISDQRQLDIRMHKKIIACEFCGRILVDNDIVEKATVLTER
jgi:predicted  nucleic acid-binding Zn-ribbon protein